MSFKINAKKFLLTFPQCVKDKSSLLSHLQHLAETRSYIVCAESHQDGTPHLHACVWFTKKIHTTCSRYFDFDGFHPNIKTLATNSDWLKAVEYCKKGGDYLTDIVVKKSCREMLAQAVIDHGRLDGDLLQQNPTLLFVNFNSVREWLSLIKKPKALIVYPTIKKRHHWIYGPSNCGKTTFLRKEIEGKNSTEIPTNNDFHCDEETEVLWIDEFKGCLTIQTLNRLCDGNTQLNKKGGHTRILFPTIYVISNYSISDCYKNASSDLLDTLYNRFTETYMSQVFP